MLNNFTLSILKPDAINRNLFVPIINIIHKHNFKIVSIKMITFSIELAKFFYKSHKEKIFFNSLINYMTSGPIIAMILEKENAVLNFRKIIGNTNPICADKNTIRKLYGESIEKNTIHASDSDKNAIREILCVFSLHEIFSENIKILYNEKECGTSRN